VVDGAHRWRRYTAAVAALAAVLPLCAQTPDSSTRRRSGEPPHAILALGDVSTSERQHDSISHALATIEGLGLRAGLFSTMIRTDTQLVTKGAIAAATGTLTFFKNLDDFDAVVLFVEGNPPLTAQQKADLLDFVRSGKGLVAIHTAVAAFDSWPEFRDMLGIRTGDNRPIEGPEEEVNSIGRSRFFPATFQMRDRLASAQPKSGVHVLAGSRSTPAVWTTNCGKGRVFVSQLGHNDRAWDREDLQHMIFEAVRWAIGEGRAH
jgi:hypothetical protein